jgi:hypothetical protein
MRPVDMLFEPWSLPSLFHKRLSLNTSGTPGTNPMRLTKLPALALALILTSPAMADVTLFEGPKPTATLYISGDSLPEPAPGQQPKPQDLPAINRGLQVKELQEHFKKLTGSELPVKAITSPDQAAGPGIVLGPVADQLAGPIPKTSEGKEGFRLLIKGDKAILSAESEQSRLFACYALLRQLGFEWVMPGDIGVVVPPLNPAKSVTLKDSDTSMAPDFLIRRMWYGGANAQIPGATERFIVWQRRQYGAYNDHVAAQTAGHYFDYFTHSNKKAFDEKPQMFALVRSPDGTMVRRGPQVETTSPELIDLIKQDIRNTFKSTNTPADKPVGRPMGPADGLGYSESNESKAAASGRIDPVIGDFDQTDLLVLLANTLLTQLTPEFPNLYLGYYNYSVHADYPMRYKPHPRMAQIFAPITYSRFHSLADSNSKSWPYYKDVVERWGALSREQGNPLLYRGYNWNLADDLLPYTKVKIWGEEIPFYKKHAFKGANVESSKADSILAVSNFTLMRMLFDSSQDWRQVLKYFCAKAYGKAAAPMEEYNLNLITRQHSAGFEAGSYFSFPLIYDTDFVNSQQAILDKALAMADSPGDRTRIMYVSYSLNMLRKYLAYDVACRAYNFNRANAIFEDIMSAWAAQKAENPDLVCEYAKIYADYFIKEFVSNAKKYSNPPYSLAYRFPDELPTILDIPAVGEKLNYQGPDINDRHFLKTRTFTSTWDAQGLNSLKKGAVWYRLHIPGAPIPKGEGISLFLGSFDDEAVVYLNGQPIGSSGVRFCQSAVFDLTDAYKPGQDNVLAIQIKRSIVANELGTGGLFRPSFLFTGPRLENKAPIQVKNERVLPGAGHAQGKPAQTK